MYYLLFKYYIILKESIWKYQSSPLGHQFPDCDFDRANELATVVIVPVNVVVNDVHIKYKEVNRMQAERGERHIQLNNLKAKQLHNTNNANQPKQTKLQT